MTRHLPVPARWLPALLLAAQAWAQIDAPTDLGASDAHTRQRWTAEANVSHYVAIVAPQTQVLSVETTIRAPGREFVTLSLPAWRPGRYVLLDPAGAIREAAAFDTGENEFHVEKLDKQTWRIRTSGAATVRFRYRIYANELGDRTRHVDDTHAFLDGSAVFMLVEGERARPQRVGFRLPEGWRVTTGLDSAPGAEHGFLAPNYDVLVDAPFEIGTHAEHDFQVGGQRHQLVVWGHDVAAARIDALTRDLGTLAAAQNAFWGDVPFGRYVWLLHVTSGARGGTEHLNSTIMQVHRDALEPGDGYDRVLSLASHEYFHTWNVKRLRPAGIHPYDYARENYSDLFWVAEGTTSYYTPILLVRAGLREPKEYFKELASSIGTHLARPGRAVQSVAEASFDAWIKHNQPNADAANSTVSFYREGALVSLVLDMELRHRTGNRVCLDDVLRALYQRFPLSGPGYRSADLLAALNEQSGTEFDAFFAAYVDGVEPLPLGAALEVVGLQLERKPAGDDGDKDGDAKGDEGEPDAEDPGDGQAEGADEDDYDPAHAAWLGVEVSSDGGFARVRSVSSEGPAFAAGVQVDDLIVTLDGRRLAAGDLDNRLKRMRPGQSVRLLLLRRDMERELTVTLGERDARQWRIRKLDDRTDAQKAAYEAWLGIAGD